MEPVLGFLWPRSQAEEEALSAKVRYGLAQTNPNVFISGMEIALEKTTRKKDVLQNQDLVQAGAHGDHGLGVLQPVGQEYRLESVLVKQNTQD